MAGIEAGRVPVYERAPRQSTLTPTGSASAIGRRFLPDFHFSVKYALICKRGYSLMPRLRHRAYVATLFDRWQISNIASFLSGRPLGITMGTAPTVNFAG